MTLPRPLVDSSRKSPVLPVVGWREWVALPELGIARIKAKVDTGARSSAIHAFGVEPFRRGGRDWVRFGVHPVQRDLSRRIAAEALLIDRRRVRNSGGRAEERFVVRTLLELRAQRFPIELTLTSRDAMGFRMLLGRQAVRGRFLVDPGGSFYDAGPRSARRARKGRS